jgi:hypothetical protein
MKHFKPGDKVRMKSEAPGFRPICEHYGTVIQQTELRVLWDCEECDGMSCDDWEYDLELIE